jgi:RES domain-containing protein
MVSRPEEPLRVFRIADSRHSLFDGTGAYLKGGRWNSSGRKIIYASQTYAGALLEALIHLNFDDLPDHYGWIEISIPGHVGIEELAPQQVPLWNALDVSGPRAYGDRWHAERRTAVLFVPSVVTGGIERNVLLSPDHAQFSEVRASSVRQVLWDERLFRR